MPKGCPPIQYKGNPYSKISYALIVEPAFFGFDKTRFTYVLRGGAIMKKRLVVIKQGNHTFCDGLAEVLNANGWTCETIELSKGEPLPKSLEYIDGLLIMGDPMSVYKQTVNPMHVYLGS
jgi:hypothetical protein